MRRTAATWSFYEESNSALSLSYFADNHGWGAMRFRWKRSILQPDIFYVLLRSVTGARNGARLNALIVRLSSCGEPPRPDHSTNKVIRLYRLVTSRIITGGAPYAPVIRANRAPTEYLRAYTAYRRRGLLWSRIFCRGLSRFQVRCWKVWPVFSIFNDGSLKCGPDIYRHSDGLHVRSRSCAVRSYVCFVHFHHITW